MSPVEIFWIPLALDVYITFFFHAAVKIRRKKKTTTTNIFSRSLKRSRRKDFFFSFSSTSRLKPDCAAPSVKVRVTLKAKAGPAFIYSAFSSFCWVIYDPTPPPKQVILAGRRKAACSRRSGVEHQRNRGRGGKMGKNGHKPGQNGMVH